METLGLGKSKTYRDPKQFPSVSKEGVERRTHCAESREPCDKDLHFVPEYRVCGIGDENLAPPAAEKNRCEPTIGSSEPGLRANVLGAGNGFKKRPQTLKKSGKKLLAKNGNSKYRSFLQFGSKTQDIRRPVKHFRRTGPSYNFQPGDEDTKLLLTKYAEVLEQYRKAGKKNMEAFRDFRLEYWYLLCNGQESIDGPVQGVRVGMCFTWRTELFLLCLHHRLQAGIDYIPAEKSPVLDGDTPVQIAVSVVVTGNFEDDVDEGERILYCGEGGRPYDGVGRGEQTAHQTLTRGNLALDNSARLGRAVRVTRKHRDESSPSGFTYSYDGMYKVSRSFTQRGRSGYKVYMFELNRLPGQGELKW